MNNYLENAIKEVMGAIPASEKKTKVPEFKVIEEEIATSSES